MDVRRDEEDGRSAISARPEKDDDRVRRARQRREARNVSDRAQVLAGPPEAHVDRGVGKGRLWLGLWLWLRASGAGAGVAAAAVARAGAARPARGRGGGGRGGGLGRHVLLAERVLRAAAQSRVRLVALGDAHDRLAAGE